MWPALPLLFACQEPFGRDRHDLVGSRIAGIEAPVAGNAVQPRLALVVDGRPWSDVEASIDWHWVDAPGDIEEHLPGQLGVGFGPSPTIDDLEGRERLGVVVSIDGVDLRAEIDLAGGPARRIEVTTAAVDGQTLDDLEGEDLSLESRRAWTDSPSRSVEPGGIGRFAIEGMEPESIGRFMATGDGTFFELDRATTDWVAGDLVVDDLEIEERQVGEPGSITVLGLEVGEGHTAFAATDFFVGDVPRGVWVSGRFVPTEMPATGRFWAQLAPADASPTGLLFRDIVPASASDTWDPETLGCDGVTGATFDPSWLLEHRCIRTDILGQRVLVEADP